MREIKFEYIFKNKYYDKFHKVIYTLKHLENFEMDIVLLENNCEIIARRQSTGLLDKNGKEIYENDIIKYGKKTLGVVLWSEGGGYWRSQTPKVTKRLGNIHFNCEVIGNVYQDSHLLQQPKGE